MQITLSPLSIIILPTCAVIDILHNVNPGLCSFSLNSFRYIIVVEHDLSVLDYLSGDSHALNNPWLNYSVYLCNTLVPAMLMIMIFMVTVFSIGTEIKDGTAQDWLNLGNDSMYISLAGKLLPQTIVFFIMSIFYNVYLYGFLHFPCNSGIFPMILASLCFVLASQGCGVVLIGTFPSLRLGLSFASLWGVIPISISGFSFPVLAMSPSLPARKSVG